jgi:hypothetical protein
MKHGGAAEKLFSGQKALRSRFCAHGIIRILSDGI